MGGIQGAAGSFLAFGSASPNLLESLFKHSFSQAWLAGISGGNMKHGFMAGFASALGGAAIGRYAANASVAVKVAANAVVGGTVAELGGGKFANGAVTGAFVMLFNHTLHNKSDYESMEKARKLSEKYIQNENRILANSILMETLLETTDIGEILSQTREALIDLYAPERQKDANAVYSEVVSKIREIKDSTGYSEAIDSGVYQVVLGLGLNTLSLQVQNSYLLCRIKYLDMRTYNVLLHQDYGDKTGGAGAKGGW